MNYFWFEQSEISRMGSCDTGTCVTSNLIKYGIKIYSSFQN